MNEIRNAMEAILYDHNNVNFPQGVLLLQLQPI